MPEAQREALRDPYHKDAFRYDAAADHYTCPTGQVLWFRGGKQRTGRPAMRVYRGVPAVCRACPAFGQCTQGDGGRSLEIGPEDTRLREHRTLMATEQARAQYQQRQQLPEPVFGIVKERHGARRLLLRGLAPVRAEWSLLATAFNLCTLWRAWRQRPRAERALLTGAALG